MSSVAICHILVALNIANSKKGFRDTKRCSKNKFHEVWAKLKSKFSFLRKPVNKYLEQIYKIH